MTESNDSGNQEFDLQNKSLPKISVINLHGNVGCAGPLNIHNCRDVIDEAFLDTETVILNINSFGGSVVQSDLINMYIKEKSAR